MPYEPDEPDEIDVTWERAKSYSAIVQKRIFSCRQSLLALLSACTASKLHNRGGFAPKGAFGALKDVMIQMASQSWAMRGGEGPPLGIKKESLLKRKICCVEKAL